MSISCWCVFCFYFGGGRIAHIRYVLYRKQPVEPVTARRGEKEIKSSINTEQNPGRPSQKLSGLFFSRAPFLYSTASSVWTRLALSSHCLRCWWDWTGGEQTQSTRAREVVPFIIISSIGSSWKWERAQYKTTSAAAAARFLMASFSVVTLFFFIHGCMCVCAYNLHLHYGYILYICIKQVDSSSSPPSISLLSLINLPLLGIFWTKTWMITE